MKANRGVMCLVAALAAVSAAEAKEPVVFIGAHPDDSYGAAATAFLLREKYDLHIVDFTHGEFGLGRPGFLDGSTKARRTAEEETAMAYLGAQLHWLDEIDGSARSSAAAVDALERILRELKPRAVFAHWPVDVHKDHVNCSAAAQTAVAKAGVPELYFFEVPFVQTKGWRPTYSVDVTRTFAEGLHMMRLYKCQNAHYLKAPQAEIRGGQHRPKVRYAETFTTFGGGRIAGGVLESLKETVLLEDFDNDNGRLVLARRGEPPRYRLVLPENPTADERKAAEIFEKGVREATETGFSSAAPHAVLFERGDAASDSDGYRVLAKDGDLHLVGGPRGLLRGVSDLLGRFSGLDAFVPGETKMPWMMDFLIPDGIDERH